MGVIEFGAIGIEQIRSDDGIENARRIDIERLHELGLGRIDRRQHVHEPLDVRARHATRGEEPDQHAVDDAVREIESRGLAHRRGRPVSILKPIEAFGSRHPQRVGLGEKRPRVLVLIERRRNPFPRVNRTHDLAKRGRERLAITRRDLDHPGKLEHVSARRLDAIAEQREKSSLHGGDAERGERRLHVLGRIRREFRLVEIDLHGSIRANRRDLAAEQRVVDMRAQVLAHLAANLVGMGDDLVQAAVLADERARLFGTDAGNAGDVVGRVALESVEIGHELGCDSVVEVVDALGRHDRHVGQALACGHDVDVFGHELVHVAVARHEVHVEAGLISQARARAQNVVAFPALRFENRHVKATEQLFDHGELRVQVGIHRRALRLVLRQHLHANARLALIERHDHGIRVERIDHFEEHVEETEDRVGGAPVRRVHARRNRMERAVHERVAVDDGYGSALF